LKNTAFPAHGILGTGAETLAGPLDHCRHVESTPRSAGYRRKIVASKMP
jgi:hypothetical protein